MLGLLRTPCILAVVVLTNISSWAGLRSVHADERNSLAGIAIYSALNYISDEGEYYGVQVAILPHPDGEKILWRSAGGKLDAPIILDATKTKNGLKVIVPETNDFFGEWSLTPKGRVLEAVGPRGHKFTLLRLTVKK